MFIYLLGILLNILVTRLIIKMFEKGGCKKIISPNLISVLLITFLSWFGLLIIIYVTIDTIDDVCFKNEEDCELCKKAKKFVEISNRFLERLYGIDNIER